MKPVLLIATDTFIPAEQRARFEERFTVHDAPTAEAQAEAFASPWIGDVQAAFVVGSRGLPKSAMDRMPRLEIVVCKGAGYDGFDIAEMRRRGIAGANAADLNAGIVADHAIALIAATVRPIAAWDRAVRRGEWKAARLPQPTFGGKRLGIVGLGAIGSQVAARAEAGLGMRVSYHNRRPAPGAPYPYVGDVETLAGQSDVLLLTCPGGSETRHLVGRRALAALGPDGFLINVARGSVVDTEALIEALEAGGIAGAGLDVVEGEPSVPPRLLACETAVITPHVGAFAPEAIAAAFDAVIANLEAHFAGQPLPSPIPRLARGEP